MVAFPRQCHQEATTACLLLSHQFEPVHRVVAVLNNDVLKEVAEIGLDGTLITRLNFEIVRQRAMRRDTAIGLVQQRTRGVAILGAPGLQLLEGLEPCIETGQFVLPGPNRARPGVDIRRHITTAAVATAAEASPTATVHAQ